MTIDLAKLWDFQDPAATEQRLRSALPNASADDSLIIQTQIARTYSIRGDFAQAQQILANIKPQIESAGAEAKVRTHLELGRTYVSSTHPLESQTLEAKEIARTAYLRAFDLAQDGKLDNLAIDALHMMAIVDTAPEDQLRWNQKALATMQASSQPQAKKWEGSLHNNTGYALHQIGRYEEALSAFKLALSARERDGNPQLIRVAYWMIAWTLRALDRLPEAVEIQLRLERECAAAGAPDPYVYEELEHLYRALNYNEQAEIYAARRKALS